VSFLFGLNVREKTRNAVSVYRTAKVLRAGVNNSTLTHCCPNYSFQVL